MKKNWFNGDRFIFIKKPSIPLPEYTFIGKFKAFLSHHEQLTDIPCANCLEFGHRTRRCRNQVVCLECKNKGHRKGHQSCPSKNHKILEVITVNSVSKSDREEGELSENESLYQDIDSDSDSEPWTKVVTKGKKLRPETKMNPDSAPNKSQESKVVSNPPNSSVGPSNIENQNVTNLENSMLSNTDDNFTSNDATDKTNIHVETVDKPDDNNLDNMISAHEKKDFRGFGQFTRTSQSFCNNTCTRTIIRSF